MPTRFFRSKNAGRDQETGQEGKNHSDIYFFEKTQPWEPADLDYIKLMLRRFKENEEIQQKFQALEFEILSILNFKDFFEILLTEMSAIFHVPYVWLSVIKRSGLAALINPLIHSRIIVERTNFISRSDFDRVLGNASTPILCNENLEPFSSFMPPHAAYKLGSIAVSPVQIDGEIVGSLNQGDMNSDRFQPDMDTSLLEQLMIKISVCLSNVAAHEKLKYAAFHDPLTGLLNRRAFESALSREFSRSRRHQHPLSLVFLDLDSFKRINDIYGHDAGDAALAYVAETLTAISREEDIIARFAGDEFVVVLPETKANTGKSLMKRIQNHLDRNPLRFKEHQLNISLSYGIASNEDTGINSPEKLLKKADERLYDVKQMKKTGCRENPPPGI
jgi:diguanylate cyclase (GGDEF)-like protein